MSGGDRGQPFEVFERAMRRRRELEEKQKAEAKAQEEAKQRGDEQKQRGNVEQKQRENEQKQRIAQQPQQPQRQQQQRQQQPMQQQPMQQQPMQQPQFRQQQLAQQQQFTQEQLRQLSFLPRATDQRQNINTGSQATGLFGQLQGQLQGIGTLLPQQQQQSSAMGFGGMTGNMGLNLTSNIIPSQTLFPQSTGYQASSQFNTQFQNPFQTGTFGRSFGSTAPQYSYPSNFQTFQSLYQRQRQQQSMYAQDNMPYYAGFPGDPHANRPSTALPPPIPMRPEDIKESQLFDDSKADTIRRGARPFNESTEQKPRVYTGATGQKYVAKKERQQYEQKSKQQQQGYDVKDDSKQPRQPGKQGPSGSGGGGPSGPGRGGPGGSGGSGGPGGPGGGGPDGDPYAEFEEEEERRRKKPIDPRQEIEEYDIIFTPDQDVVLDIVPKPPYFSISLSIVSVGRRHNQRAVGHIALMDYFGKTHLNVYVKPDKPVVSFFSPNTGLRLDRIENEWIPFNEAREILIQRLPKNACLVGHFISDTISWLDIKQGIHFRESLDVNTIWKAWSSSLRGFMVYPLLHQAQCVLNLPAYQFYPSATNKARVVSRLLQTYIHNKEFNPFLIQHYKHNLRAIEPIPCFEIVYPYFEGVCQGVKKYCRCGADVIPFQPQFRYYRGYFKPWVPKQSYIPYGRRITRTMTITDDVIRQKLLRLLGPEYENYRGSLQLTDIKEDIREDQFEDSKDDSKDDTKEDIKAADDDDDDEDEQKRIIETKTETKGADDTKADE